mmetsp:Transcript_77878/g.252462  ORF Transcript_77878/g.252462 Transcript_77878/m.252462 type:complete len:551 (-) Transcript_77878:193-1845(-)|eukprot:CAMPEP_0204179558 /NCGR_PEP_ID=MMETSP0361-20130328/50247_1 /ASSEMBLY_ACC=CAM_ASM_000343 /TAXON_ID=268821 /ORGANISM="Scrippsiella Hangoei, Strain SHTV-5" /LENGTH=550 /DNA_ID=CAMNT_0051138843 /DNA_START=35 /DNA_END=1687 /DNA_ORIENTATION=+
MPPKAKPKSRFDMASGSSAGCVAAEEGSLDGLAAGSRHPPEPAKADAPPPDPAAAERPAGFGVAAARQLHLWAARLGSTLQCQVPQRVEEEVVEDIPVGDIESCPICLDALSGQQLGVCVGVDGCRSCLHYFHLDCLRRVEGAHCPQCRVRFRKRSALPDIKEDVAAWCSLVSMGDKDALGRRELSAALKAMLRLPAGSVETLVETWMDRAQGGDGLRAASIAKLVPALGRHMPSLTGEGSSSSKAASSISSFEQLEDGHGKTGTVCKCGRIHVRRGDRIRRGPAQSDTDKGVAKGQLGTIVRIGAGQEIVTVKWDRSPLDEVHRYTWPDPAGNFIASASYTDVAEDVQQLQRKTGLSSAAAENALSRGGSDAPAGRAAKMDADVSEDSLRGQLQPFHRVRILPDSILVQEWFDRIPPCQCSRQGCAGGVHWNSRADKHLGREGLLLKIDTTDDTVLIETSGPCQCQIWYPRLAVEPVFDPDLADKPEFKVGAQVECKMQQSWERGAVIEVLWNGATRQGRCPYHVKLESGETIVVPHVSLIRGVGGGDS